MGALFQEARIGYKNTYTDGRKLRLTISDKISDILLTHSRIDNILLGLVGDYFRDELNNDKLFESFFRDNCPEKNRKKLLELLRKRCSGNATKLEPIARPSFFPIWGLFGYYIAFDYSGQAKYLIERELGLDYCTKINLLDQLGYWNKTDSTPETLRKMGEKRNEVVHSDIIEGNNIKRNDKNLRENKDLYEHFEKMFGEVTPNIRGDIDTIYKEYMKKYNSLESDFKRETKR